MKVLGVIPARYASSRFPGKPLAVIQGKSMIRRVFEQASLCSGLDEVIVATEDARIETHVLSFGGKVMMTSPDHGSGTERCAEVAKKTGRDFDVVINIQGDEPFIDPCQISQVAGCFDDPGVQIATLVRKIVRFEDIDDPNVVKVLFDKNQKAICFSRSPIPHDRGKPHSSWINDFDYFKHIGIYGYRGSVLRELVGLPPCRLEKAESLEQLRWIWHGYSIHVRETECESIAIDTPADLLKITNIPG
jgi:3-deoxy-manno-octulosonate cytidylyltransferase (CMP-KDO synthetase)